MFLKFKISLITMVFLFLYVAPICSMKIIGHRGACGYEPENTLRSFQRALDMGVDMIELDVYVCATGELVVLHDPGIALRAMPSNSDFTINQQSDVGDMPFDFLRSLLIEGKGQIPTLQEVVDLINRRIPINIELKGPGTAKPVAELVKKYLKKGWKRTDFVVSSFDHEQAAEFKKLCPKIQVGVLFPCWNMPADIVSVAQKYRANFIGLDLKAVTDELVVAAQSAGFPVFVWTVNDKLTADRLRSMHVDGIFTNYPDLV